MMPTKPPCDGQQRPTMVQEFCNRAQARFSAFFHGHSVLTKERYGMSNNKSETACAYRQHVPIARDGLRRDGPASRSRTSTRSLIDPISSPLSSPGSPRAEELWHYRGAFFRPVSTLAPAPRIETRTDHRQRAHVPIHCQRLSLPRMAKEKRRCLPNVKDRQIKYKIIGSLIFGTLLVLFLTSCEYLLCLRSSRLTYGLDLALAVSSSVTSQTFHVVMIVFILALTMIFCHFLIRLCMMSFRLHLRGRRQIERVPSVADEEDYAQPEIPIPVILARDEELGLHNTSSDNDSVRPVQHPPPAYGLWRSSVVSTSRSPTPSSWSIMLIP